VKRRRAYTIELALEDVHPDDVHNVLHKLDEVWYGVKGFFEPSVTPVIDKIGTREGFKIGVFVFSSAQGRVLLLALTECEDPERMCFLQLHMKQYYALSGWKVEVRWEQKLAEALKKEIESRKGRTPHEGHFTCPKCGAVYSYEILDVSSDGQVRCQNCAAWIDWADAVVPRGTTSNDS
jgi:hypothetical protein